MPQIQKSQKLPYAPERMFDLVADVARYPEFLPWCAAASLVKKDDREIIGRLTAQKSGFRKSFTTRNRYRYPDWMDIALVDGPFKHLSGRWEFVPDGQGCTVRYQMSFEVPFFLAPVFGGLMEYIANTMVVSFVGRAEAVYGLDHD